MDEYTAKHLRRIEKKIDLVIGLGGGGFGFFGIPWMSEEIHKNYGWSTDWSFIITFIAFIAIGAWFVRRFEGD